MIVRTPLFLSALALCGGLAAASGNGYTLSLDQPVYDITEVAHLAVKATPGTFGGVLFDPVPGPIAVPGIGIFGIGFSPALSIYYLGVMPAAGQVVLSCDFGCDSGVLNGPIYIQGVAIDVSVPEICLSNTEVLVYQNLSGACDPTGCTPGYWKNHEEAWGPTGLSPSDDFDATFGVDVFNPDLTLLEALNPTNSGFKNLVPHAVAALLNSLHPDENSEFTSDQVITMTQQALESGDEGQMETTKNGLAAANEIGCPF